MRRYAIVFVGSMITIFMVSAGKSDILMKSMVKPWMSRDDFASLIDVSYNVPQCVNIFICDQNMGTERLFKEFISIYQHVYVLNSTLSYCDNYLLIGRFKSSVLKYAKSLFMYTVNDKMEVLILIDDIIKERREVYDDTFDERYEKTCILRNWVFSTANVNVAARNGLWTLTYHFVFSGKFKRVRSYDKMVHPKRILNCEGDNWYVAAMYNPPFCFLRTTVNRTIYEREEEVFTEEDESEVDGVELKLFQLIAERINISYTFLKLTPKSITGTRNGSVWEGNKISDVSRRDVFFYFGGLWLTQDNTNDFMTLTIPWKTVNLQFLVPRPKPHSNFWALITPLSPEMWAGILVVLIAQSVCLYTGAWIDSRIPKKFRSFTNAWTELMAGLLGTYAPRDIQCLKLQFQLWYIFGVIMVTAYSSSLAARLTSKLYDKRIDTAEDFIAANLTWGRKLMITNFSHYFDLSDPYAARIPDSFEYETNPARRQEKILEGNYAIYGSRISSAFFPTDYVSNEDLKGYRLMRDTMKEYYLAIGVTRWFEKSVNQIMRWMQESGLVEYHFNNVLHRRMPSALREVLIEYDINDAEPTVLELTPFGVGFILYFIGLFLATAAFYLELRSVRGSGTIREVLFDIKQKREIQESRKEIRRCMELHVKHPSFNKFCRKKYGFSPSRHSI